MHGPSNQVIEADLAELLSKFVGIFLDNDDADWRSLVPSGVVDLRDRRNAPRSRHEKRFGRGHIGDNRATSNATKLDA